MRRLVPLLLLLALPTFGQSLDWGVRGYQQRACGFDLDNDGIQGGTGDCDIGNAKVVDGVIVARTTDPDRDGNDEDIIYIDCDAGADQPKCGLSGEPPCLTIEYAVDNIGDGPFVGEEDIFVFKGICSPDNYSFATTFKGTTDYWTRSAAGDEHFDFRYPAEPAMLIGWDYDGDGEYPPYDTDDTSRLDGSGLNRAFVTCDGVSGAQNHHVEFAHFEVHDYNYIPVTDGLGNSGGFFLLGETNAHDCSLTYFHDLELFNINRENGLVNGARVFSLRMQGSPYVAIENVLMDHYGGYASRGGSGNGTQTGPHRQSFITGTADPCDYDGGTPTVAKCTGARAGSCVSKLWGWLTNVEYLNSHWELLTDESDTYHANGLVIDGGQHKSWVTNNRFVNHTNYSVNIDAETNGVVNRDTGPVYVERNEIISTADSGQHWTAQIVTLANPSSATETLTEFYVTENLIHLEAHHRAQSGIKLYIASDTAPTRNSNYILNNTFWVDSSPTIGVVGHARKYNIETLEISHNLFLGTASAGVDIFQIDREPEVSTLIDHNIFVSAVDADWRCGGTTYTTFAQWRAGTCGGIRPDLNSQRCTPSRVSSPADTYIVSSEDCTRDAGTSSAELPQSRPLGYESVSNPDLEVAVLIDPLRNPGVVDQRATDLLPVAVLTTHRSKGEALDFEASEVDVLSVLFGPGRADIVVRSMATLEDVDADGDQDLLLFFRANRLGFGCGDSDASLEGQTTEGKAFRGSSPVIISGCE